jgi:erythromycin esterase-like protein
MLNAFRFRAAAALCTLLLAAACGETSTGPAPEQLEVVESVAQAAIPLTGAAGDYDPLLAMLAGRRFALLGEATHGTHEFYAERAEISQRLIAEQGFAAVIVEGEWWDASRADSYVHGLNADASAAASLTAFNQFPLWMWRNQEVAGFLDWLRVHNAARAPEQRVGFYGMDVYGLMESLREVPRILDPFDADAAEQARARYACFAPYPRAEAYGRAVSGGDVPSGGSAECAAPAEAQFAELQARWNAAPGDERLFNAMQHARVVVGAEKYFRTIYRGGSGWNQRDRHMTATVTDLSRHLQARGLSGKVIVWAHNSHVGDARAAESAGMDETLGGLMRQEHGAQVGLVGFTTYEGTVMAAESWGMPGEVRDVRPALSGSWESAFHQTGIPAFLLLLQEPRTAGEIGETELLERAIGVSYHPQTERQSHYFSARMTGRFDAVIHIDRTSAVNPLAQ